MTSVFCWISLWYTLLHETFELINWSQLCVIAENCVCHRVEGRGAWADVSGLPQKKERPAPRLNPPPHYPTLWIFFFFHIFLHTKDKIAPASFYQHFCLLRMCQTQDLVSHLSERLALSPSSHFSRSYYQPFWSCYSFCQSFSSCFLRCCHFHVAVHCVDAWLWSRSVDTDLGEQRRSTEGFVFCKY